MIHRSEFRWSWWEEAGNLDLAGYFDVIGRRRVEHKELLEVSAGESCDEDRETLTAVRCNMT